MLLILSVSIVLSGCDSPKAPEATKDASSLPTTQARGDPKPLSKSDAGRLLMNMGYNPATVIAIIPGLGKGGASPSLAMVLGIGQQNGRMAEIEQVFTYDEDLGWFYHEFKTDPQTGAVVGFRLWTVGGYDEIQPPALYVPGKM